MAGVNADGTDRTAVVRTGSTVPSRRRERGRLSGVRPAVHPDGEAPLSCLRITGDGG